MAVLVVQSTCPRCAVTVLQLGTETRGAASYQCGTLAAASFPETMPLPALMGPGRKESFLARDNYERGQGADPTDKESRTQGGCPADCCYSVWGAWPLNNLHGSLLDFSAMLKRALQPITSHPSTLSSLLTIQTVSDLDSASPWQLHHASKPIRQGPSLCLDWLGSWQSW